MAPPAEAEPVEFVEHVTATALAIRLFTHLRPGPTIR